MIGKEQLEVDPSRIAERGSVGIDLHALSDRGNARRLEAAGALYLDKADTAGADLVYVFKIAEGGDIYMCLAGGFKDRIACRNGDLDPVDCKINGVHLCVLLISWK